MEKKSSTSNTIWSGEWEYTPIWPPPCAPRWSNMALDSQGNLIVTNWVGDRYFEDGYDKTESYKASYLEQVNKRRKEKGMPPVDYCGNKISDDDCKSTTKKSTYVDDDCKSTTKKSTYVDYDDASAEFSNIEIPSASEINRSFGNKELNKAIKDSVEAIKAAAESGKNSTKISVDSKKVLDQLVLKLKDRGYTTRLDYYSVEISW